MEFKVDDEVIVLRFDWSIENDIVGKIGKVVKTNGSKFNPLVIQVVFSPHIELRGVFETGPIRFATDELILNTPMARALYLE